MYSASGGRSEPTRSGQHHSAVSPLGLFSVRPLHIIAMVSQWINLCVAMGKSQLLEDQRFNDLRERVKTACAGGHYCSLDGLNAQR